MRDYCRPTFPFTRVALRSDVNCRFMPNTDQERLFIGVGRFCRHCCLDERRRDVRLS